MTREICAATHRFYADHAAAFSDTRQRPWEGWEQLTPFLDELPPSPSVLDAACGNLRFERFLDGKGIRPARVFAVDACGELLDADAPDTMAVERICADIIGILDTDSPFESLGIPPCDITVAFGFMHHVPTSELRRSFLEALINATAPGGLCVLSFWQFSKDERIAKKAVQATAQAQEALGITLSNGRDHFLGWEDVEGAFRFCHDFADGEVGALAAVAESCGATTVDSFCADGKEGNLNRYLVLRRR